MTALERPALDLVVELLSEARTVIDAHLHRTEVRDLDWLRPYARRPVVAMLETQQVTGSFKVRGALFALSRLEPGAHVVAPSAGNHGLAVAWAARRLGFNADIVLPQNASPLKRERILGLGAGVIEAGSTLEDATDEAHRVADLRHCHYVSPYNDLAIVAGQATAVVELLEQRQDIRSLVIPVGGGGLLSGAIAARSLLGRPLHIVAGEPANFASMAASASAGTVVRLGRRATFADGLALNMEPGSVTFDIVAAADELTFRSVGEAEIAAAATAVFNREAVLIEGAAAVGVAAALGADRFGLLPGPVGIILCGSNVHHTTFWQMTTYPQTDPVLVGLADTMGRSVDAEPVRRQLLARAPRARAVDDSAVDEVGLPDEVVAAIGHYTDKTRSMLDDFAELARDDGLPLDHNLVRVVGAVNDEVSTMLRADPPAGPRLPLREQRVRVLSQLAVAARMAFEWRSPGYEQSAALSQFDLGALDAPGVNYARYDQPGTAEIEDQLAELLGISPRTHAVLTTSSGMAAFTLATAALASMRPLRSVVTAPYLYFESMETLSYLLGNRVAVSRSYAADELADLADGRDAVFADPLANHPEQRMVDVERLAALLAARDRPPWLVVDGSMLPLATALPVTTALPEAAVYYESCSKYLQFGLDMAMAGMVVVPRSLEPLARRVRRNLGLGLDRYGAELFPRYRYEHLSRRLAAMERAALVVSTELAAALPGDRFQVAFLGLDSHPDHQLATRIGRTGSCVTLAPVDRELSRDQLDPIVNAAVREAALRGVPLVKGVSFGFSVSRLSAAAAMAEGAPPFLRLAVGVLDTVSAIELADVVRCAVEQVTARWAG